MDELIDRLARLVYSTAARDSKQLSRRTVMHRGPRILSALFVASIGGRLSNDRLVQAAAPRDQGYYPVAEKLDNQDFNTMLQRSENDKHFQIIQDYFGKELNWRQVDREGIAIFDKGRRKANAFFRVYKPHGEKHWAYVVYMKRAGGPQNSRGYTFRGDDHRFLNEFFVENGILRRKGVGPVQDSVSAAADRCEVLVKGSCATIVGATAVTCLYGSSPPTAAGCGIGAAASYLCQDYGDEAINTCREQPTGANTPCGSLLCLYPCNPEVDHGCQPYPGLG